MLGLGWSGGEVRRLLRRALAGALLGCCLFVAPAARATSCAVPTLETSLPSADVVFLAKVSSGGKDGVFVLAVSRVFKGRVPAAVKVQAGGLKGAMLTVGNRYLVFAKLTDSHDVPLFAHLCGGTKPENEADTWVAQLGRGKRTSPDLESGNASPGGPAENPVAEPETPPAANSTSEAPGAPSATETPAPAPAPSAAPPNSAAAQPSPPPPEAPRSGCAGCVLGAGSSADPSQALGLSVIALGALRRANKARAKNRRRTRIGT